MSFKSSIQFLVLCFSIFALNACGGKSTKADKPVTESESKKCDGKCDKEKCKGHKDGAKCDKHKKPEISPESAANMKPNDGAAQIGDVTMCPVTNSAFTISADSPKAEIDGKTYYFCCKGCVDKFKADPAKYLNAKPASSSESASSALPNDGTRQVGEVTKCPVTGKLFTVANDSPKADLDGKTYYFCCGGCVDKFKANPAKYL